MNTPYHATYAAPHQALTGAAGQTFLAHAASPRGLPSPTQVHRTASYARPLPTGCVPSGGCHTVASHGRHAGGAIYGHAQPQQLLHHPQHTGVSNAPAAAGGGPLLPSRSVHLPVAVGSAASCSAAAGAQVGSPAVPTRMVSTFKAPGAPPPVTTGGRPHRHTQAHPGAYPTYMSSSVIRSVSSGQLSPRLVVSRRQENGALSPKSPRAKSKEVSDIIRKFEQAMTSNSETVLTSSLRDLDDATTSRLQDISETELPGVSPRGCSVAESASSYQTGLSRSPTSMSIPLTVRSPRNSQRGPCRQASGPSLKALAMAAAGVNVAPGSPRSGWPSISRSSSANAFGIFDRARNRSRSPSEPGTPMEGRTVGSIPETNHEALLTPWEQYKNAARRAKLLQHQLALATAEADAAAAMIRSASVAELPDSGRSAGGASSSAGSVGSRRIQSGRRVTPRSVEGCAGGEPPQESLQEDQCGEMVEDEEAQRNLAHDKAAQNKDLNDGGGVINQGSRMPIEAPRIG